MIDAIYQTNVYHIVPVLCFVLSVVAVDVWLLSVALDAVIVATAIC